MNKTEILESKLKLLELDLTKWKNSSKKALEEVADVRRELTSAQDKVTLLEDVAGTLRWQLDKAQASVKRWKFGAKFYWSKDRHARKYTEERMERMKKDISFYRQIGRLFSARVLGFEENANV